MSGEEATTDPGKNDNDAASQSSVSPVRISGDNRLAKQMAEEWVKRHLTPDVVVIDPLYKRDGGDRQ